MNPLETEIENQKRNNKYQKLKENRKIAKEFKPI